MLKPIIFNAELNSITDIASLLKFCDQLMLRHQIALMHKQYQKAFLYFEQVYEYRIYNLQFMQNYLLPVYKSKIYPTPEGGNERFFIREKKLIEKHLSKYIRFFSHLVLKVEEIKLDIVELFENYVYLKDLLDHHDARERGILFPAVKSAINNEIELELLEIYKSSLQKINIKWP